MVKLVLAGLLFACSSKPSRPATGYSVAEESPDHQLHITETPEADGIRLKISGKGVSIAELKLPDWIMVPIGGTFDVAADLYMAHAAKRDYRVAVGEATLRCIACTIGGELSPSTAGGSNGSDSSSPVFPKYTIDHFEARAVFGKGSADITKWSVESKEVRVELTGHLDLAAALGDSSATFCIRVGSKAGSLTPGSPAGQFLAEAGIAIDTNGLRNFKLAGHLDSMVPEGFGCDGAAPPPPRAAPAPAPAPAVAEHQLRDGIVIVDGTHRTITRSLVDAIMANPMAIVKSARVILPKNDQREGVKISTIQPDSLFARLGLTNGDTITSVNGSDVSTAEKLLEVYTTLRTATSIEVGIARHGKPIKLKISIID